VTDLYIDREALDVFEHFLKFLGLELRRNAFEVGICLSEDIDPHSPEFVERIQKMNADRNSPFEDPPMDRTMQSE